MLRRRRRPTLIVVTCLSAVVHAGQMSHQNPPPPLVCHELELDPPGPNEFYTGTSALDIDGDCIMDVAYLIGSRVEVLLAPGLYEARMTNVCDGRDIAVCERAGRDDLLVVGAAGLSRVAWNAAGAIEADFWSATPLAAGDWCDAHPLDDDARRVLALVERRGARRRSQRDDGGQRRRARVDATSCSAPDPSNH